MMLHEKLFATAIGLEILGTGAMEAGNWIISLVLIVPGILVALLGLKAMKD